MIERRKQQLPLLAGLDTLDQVRRNRKARAAMGRAERRGIDNDPKVDAFWNSDLGTEFERGFDVWRAFGYENTTRAGLNVNQTSSMLEQVFSDNRFGEIFKKSFGLSGIAIARKLRSEGRRLAHFHSVNLSSMLNYAADIAQVMGKVRGFTPSYREKINREIYHGKTLTFNRP